MANLQMVIIYKKEAVIRLTSFTEFGLRRLTQRTGDPQRPFDTDVIPAEFAIRRKADFLRPGADRSR